MAKVIQQVRRSYAVNSDIVEVNISSEKEYLL